MTKVVTGTYDESGDRTEHAVDEFDAFATALAGALRAKYRGQGSARDFAKRCAEDLLPHLVVREVVVRTDDAFEDGPTRVIRTKIEILGEVSA